VALSADGTKLVTAAIDEKTATLWDATGKKLQTLGAGAYGVSLTADGGRVLLARAEEASLWNSATGEKIHSFKGKFTGETWASVSGDGKLVVVGSLYNVMSLWDAATGKQLHSFDVFAFAVKLSADGKRLLSASSDAALWDTATGKKLLSFKGTGHSIKCLALSADGKYAAAGSSDARAVVWDLTTGKQLQTFVGHTALINGVALSPNGKHLWTASLDGSTRLWDTATGKQLAALYSFGGGEWLVIGADGHFDGSEKAMMKMAWREPDTLQVIHGAATRQKYHQPNLLATLLKSEKPQGGE
jgi:WD40 repeat protein